MRYLNKLSGNKTELAVQNYYHELGYQSIKRGWPDFCFWKSLPGGKRKYIFVEVKKPVVPGSPFSRKKKNRQPVTPAQRRIKNIFLDLGLDYRVAFGLLPDGTPDFRVNVAGINRHLKKEQHNKNNV